MQLLACGQDTASKPKTIVWKGAEILDFLVLAVLEDAQHVVSLLELMLHLLCFEILALQNAFLKIELLSLLLNLLFISVMLCLFIHHLISLLVQLLAGLLDLRVLLFEFDALFFKLFLLANHFLSI